MPVREDIYAYYNSIILLKNRAVSDYKQRRLINGEYGMRIPLKIKYDLLWQMFIKTPNDELFGYIRKNFTIMFQFAVDRGDVNAVSAVCQNGKLLTKRNIDKFIDRDQKS